MIIKLLRISAFCGIYAALFQSAMRGQDEPSLSSEPASNVNDWLQWKMFRFRPSLSSSLIFDDNLNLSQSNALSDVTWNLNPGVSISAGESGGRTLSLNYNPVIRVFAEHTENNAFDHLFSLRVLWPFSRLTLGATAGYDKLSTPLTYVGTRVDRQAYNMGVDADYALSPKTSLSVTADYNQTSFSDDLIGSSDFSNDNSIKYQITPKLNLGLGGTFGLMQPDRGSDQTSQEVSLRAHYNVAAKLDISASAGSAWRQYEGIDGSSVSPVFSLSAHYFPLDGTTFILEGHRNNALSPTSTGVNYNSTGFGITIRQQVLESFSARLVTSYDHLEYLANGASASLRRDNYYMIELGLDVNLSQHWNAGIFVLHRESSSDSSRGVEFINNQVGIQTSYSF